MPTLRKRGRVWYSDVYIRKKRVRHPLSTDKGVAEDRLADLVKQRDGARYGHAAQNLSWPEFKEKYLSYSRGKKKGSTPARDAAAISALERFETPAKLEHITPEFLERWRAARRAAGKGAATIARDLTAVKAMLRKAVAWGYTGQQPWSSVELPKTTRGKLIFYTVAELRRLLAKCRTMYPDKSHNARPHDWVTMAKLGARAGLRRGEMLHLAWEDVDLRRRVLSITPKKCPCCPGGLWEPKDYEQRHIPIPKDLMKHLAGLPRTTEWVMGKRPSLAVVSAYFARIVRKAKLKGSLHTTRHTYASHLVQNGVDIFTVSKLLGHASVKTTMIYAHLAPKTYEDAVGRLPAL